MGKNRVLKLAPVCMYRVSQQRCLLQFRFMCIEMCRCIYNNRMRSVSRGTSSGDLVKYYTTHEGSEDVEISRGDSRKKIALTPRVKEGIERARHLKTKLDQRRMDSLPSTSKSHSTAAIKRLCPVEVKSILKDVLQTPWMDDIRTICGMMQTEVFSCAVLGKSTLVWEDGEFLNPSHWQEAMMITYRRGIGIIIRQTKTSFTYSSASESTHQIQTDLLYTFSRAYLRMWKVCYANLFRLSPSNLVLSGCSNAITCRAALAWQGCRIEAAGEYWHL